MNESSDSRPTATAKNDTHMILPAKQSFDACQPPRTDFRDPFLRALADRQVDHVLRRPERLDRDSAWFGHVAFAQWLVRAAKPGLLVELGTHAGISFAAFCLGVESECLDTRCYAVDTWRGDPHAGFYDEEVFTELEAYVGRRFGAFAYLVRSTFDEALTQFRDGSIDVLHIDGLHTADAVRHDFEAWLPKLSDRAVVLLHDTAERQRDFGVWRLWTELADRYPAFEFSHAHGLGVLCIGENAPEAVLELCRVGHAHPDIGASLRTRFAWFGARWEAEAGGQRLERDISNFRERIAELERVRRAEVKAEAERAEAAQTRLGEVESQLQLLKAREAELNDVQSRLEHELETKGSALAAAEAALRAAKISAASELLSARTEADALRAELTVTTAHLAEMTTEAHAISTRLQNIVESTWWKAGHPVRQSLKNRPLLRRVLRRCLTLGWWTATGQAPRRLRERRRAITSAQQSADARLPTPALPKLPARAYPSANRWCDDLNPEVSIIILNFNKAELTLACLDSIWRYTDGVSYEIVLLDNGSHQADYEILVEAGGRRKLLRVEANRMFGEGNNIAVENACAEVICFLNNDTIVTPGWLSALLQTLRTQPTAGIVGPKFVYPDGRLQEAGGMILPNGTAQQLGKGQEAADPEFNAERLVDYVSAACALMAKDLFIELGGFDLLWEPAYYEDVDLCFKARASGRTVHYCPRSVVVHLENASHREVAGIQETIEANRTKFAARWHSALAAQPIANGSLTTPSAASRGTGECQVVVFEPYPLTPGGGERHILTIAEHLSRTAKVVVATPHPYSDLRLTNLGQLFGLDLANVAATAIRDITKPIHADLLIAIGNEAVPPIPPSPGRSFYICQFPFPQPADYIRQRRDWLDGYQAVLVYSDFVRQNYLRALQEHGLPPISVEVLSPPVETGRLLNRAKQPIPGRILSIGRFFSGGHCKRQDRLITAFSSLLRDSRYQLELHLVGSLAPGEEHREYLQFCRELAKDLPISFHLNADRKLLEDLLSSSSIYWHAAGLDADPVKSPSGLEHFGISIAESMDAGCIALAPRRGGPIEIIEDAISGFLYENIPALVAITSRVLENGSQAWVQKMRRAAAHRAQVFSVQEFRRRCDDLFGVRYPPYYPHAASDPFLEKAMT